MIRVGQKLHEERVKRGLSIEDVARATKIHPSYITAIEKSEYKKIPSPAYATGFVRNYAEYLGLPKRETLALFRREFDEKRVYEVLPEGLTRRQDFPTRRLRIRRRVIALVGLFLLLGGFLFYQNRMAFFSPPLRIETPEESVISAQEVTVTGKTETSATVLVNNVPVAVDQEGRFSKVLPVFPGKSVIVVKAKNRLGKETVVEREIQVKE